MDIIEILLQLLLITALNLPLIVFEAKFCLSFLIPKYEQFRQGKAKISYGSDIGISVTHHQLEQTRIKFYVLWYNILALAWIMQPRTKPSKRYGGSRIGLDLTIEEWQDNAANRGWWGKVSSKYPQWKEMQSRRQNTIL